MTTTQTVYKGHGTRNDFVLIDDPHGSVDLTPELVRALADRRSGIGGDGVIRLIRSENLAGGRVLLENHPEAEWFMDYHNADGSIAQMCGNGVRVFAAFYELLGMGDCAGSPLPVGTRAGVRTVSRDEPSGWYTVTMGPGVLVHEQAARTDGFDSQVAARGLDGGPRVAVSVDFGNPHTVVALANRDELANLDLSAQPSVDPVPSHGTNVEFAVPLGEDESAGVPVGRVAMRVHERGVGETESCGTGACAVAVAMHLWGGPSSPTRWLIDVPGGQVEADVANPGQVTLSGPARIVARGEVFLDQLLR